MRPGEDARHTRTASAHHRHGITSAWHSAKHLPALHEIIDGTIDLCTYGSAMMDIQIVGASILHTLELRAKGSRIVARNSRAGPCKVASSGHSSLLYRGGVGNMESLFT